MIALKPFNRKVGHAMAHVLEGREIPKVVLLSYSEDELKELKDKKIIGDSPSDKKDDKDDKDDKGNKK